MITSDGDQMIARKSAEAIFKGLNSEMKLPPDYVAGFVDGEGFIICLMKDMVGILTLF